MSYLKWFVKHNNKHKKIIDKLLAKGFNKEQIINYFAFDNMVQNEPDFCPLYKDSRKCHDYEELNCYLCACPNFRFNDNGIKDIDGKTVFSICSINSKDGKIFISKDAIHQDCSGCLIPHRYKYIDDNFKFNWLEVMRLCQA